MPLCPLYTISFGNVKGIYVSFIDLCQKLDMVKNLPDLVNNWPDSVNNWPDSAKNELDPVKTDLYCSIDSTPMYKKVT